jgi:hypothetical protein
MPFRRLPRAFSPAFSPWRPAIILLILFLLLLGCSRNIITREQWRTKTPEQKELIVRSMMGGENAADAKGGKGDHYSKAVDYYRNEIDRRYDTGDQRNVNDIWKELKD